MGPVNNGHGWSLVPKLRILDGDVCDSVVQSLPGMFESLCSNPNTGGVPAPPACQLESMALDYAHRQTAMRTERCVLPGPAVMVGCEGA